MADPDRHDPGEAAREEAQRALREDVLASMRAEEDALYAKNRTKPPEAYLAHTYAVLEAVRPTQGDVLPLGIRTLVKHCEANELRYELSKTLASDTDGFGATVHVESICFLGAGVFVAYENGQFARSLSGKYGKGNLSDAKRALGIDVPERKPRAVKPKTAAKAAGKQDTLR